METTLFVDQDAFQPITVKVTIQSREEFDGLKYMARNMDRDTLAEALCYYLEVRDGVDSVEADQDRIYNSMSQLEVLAMQIMEAAKGK